MLTMNTPAGIREARSLFSFEHLATLAPWVYEQIMDIGRERIAEELLSHNESPLEELPIVVWVAAIQSARRCH